MPRQDPIFEARAKVQWHMKRLKKEAIRAGKTSEAEEKKADRAIENREFDIARIHAGSAVREKKRQIKLKYEAAHAEVIINELKAVQSTRDTAYTLAVASKGLEAASRSVNLENLLSHANNFLARSEDFKIASNAIEEVAQGVSMQENGPEGQEEVDRLMQKLADKAGVDLRMTLEQDSAPKEEVRERAAAEPVHADADVEDALGARLRALRAGS
ncbi:hypothetical protein DTO207G8_4609 [Paecilomyces variotii]|nr:hypothetical protein DTO207G8_4609 [Paecilomyces variotii]